MKGATIVVKSFEDLGVKHVFGYTGAAILPVMDELGQSSIEIVVSSNEQSAAFSAAGYSRASDRIGIAIVTSGPAITNTLTAVADSFADSVPLIVIAGQVPEHKIGTDSFQHIDVASVFGQTAKHVVTVTSIRDIETVIKDAYFRARAGKPGPVVIDMPINLQQNVNRYSGDNLARFANTYQDECHLSDGQCGHFFELLAAAKRPLLYLGGGLNSRAGSAAIRRFNALLNIPSVNTLMGKGVVDENDPTSLGLLGMFGTPYANKIIQRNDFFFAVGVRWDDRVAEKVGFAIDAKIAYIDINPQKVYQIRTERSPEFSFVGDAATALDDLTDYARRNRPAIDIAEWIEYAKMLKCSWPLDYRRDGPSIQQAEVLDLLNRHLTNDTIITTGVGNHQLQAAQYLRMNRPKSFLTSGSFGTMGFGMPSAVGAHYANPSAQVLVIDGDGSFRMNMGEMYTIGTRNLPIKVLLLNNMSDGMVKNLEDVAYGGRHSATERTRDVNFAEMARQCHFRFARRIDCRTEMADAIAEFINSQGPCLLEVMTDTEEVLYPVVRPGTSYADMVLGPYICEVPEGTGQGAAKSADAERATPL
ncbi:MAG: thiamine pyrophosphate-binding protein [Thermoguttaceae bacterium]|jgi:acetolactate synthase-1/2/3 large subunit|nr:thiamine pyrophosphate-binding protein [Thermoguttaceae bacterium]